MVFLVLSVQNADSELAGAAIANSCITDLETLLEHQFKQVFIFSGRFNFKIWITSIKVLPSLSQLQTRGIPNFNFREFSLTDSCLIPFDNYLVARPPPQAPTSTSSTPLIPSTSNHQQHAPHPQHLHPPAARPSTPSTCIHQHYAPPPPCGGEDHVD